jgi:hypothetical protein
MEKLIKKSLTRVVIYIKDIENLTGRKPGAARNLYYNILKAFDKKPGQFITYHEFSIFTGIDETVVQEYLRS